MSLNIGEQAPAFEGKDQNGNLIKLEDFKGKKVVLYFYPKDNTPGCTAQACNLRDNYEALQQQGYQVIGVSTDGETSHQKFIAKHELPFPLIADEDKKVHELYGTWAEKKNYGRTYMGTVRTTFIIDEEGKLEEIIEKVKTKEHTAQILK
ncbi:thioredoxin-dependent thiol peroxidase [Persicobacter psychrovividus]|uniref:thioredoxin-dependent peroxiredoxin n=1 Tax=Persicobacter psychrovividus TaxID=387638 RepID=A0ABM7VDF0_9BACT|nr:peroxiredoxin [Persicobacter psychrovividus]